MRAERGSETVYVYAFGGGLGHAMRGCAVARELGAVVLVPRRVAWIARALGVRARVFDGRPEGLGAWMDSLPRPDVLVVDVFPRGVMGELTPDAAPRRVLLARHARAGFYDRVDGYDAVICSEPVEGLDGTRVAPILARWPVLDRGLARQALRVGDQRLLMVLGTGTREEQRVTYRRAVGLSRRLPAGWTMRYVSLALPPDARAEVPRVHLFPVAPWLAGADAVLSAAGYHTWHELGRAGVPSLLVPLPRQVDDQAARADGRLGGGPAWRRRVGSVAEVLEALAAAPEAHEPREVGDGAAEAATHIRSMEAAAAGSAPTCAIAPPLPISAAPG